MSYFVNTADDAIICDKCGSRIGIAKGFYSPFGRILCCDCQDRFVDFVKEKYQEFIKPQNNQDCRQK